MTQAFEITFRKATKPGTFWPIYGGEKLTNATRQPFFDGARALLADGVNPEWTLIGRHEGSQTIALQSTVGEAAKWSVSEPDRGKCTRIPYQPYKPGSSATADSPDADVAVGDTTEGVEARGRATPLTDCQDERPTGGITHADDSPLMPRRMVPRFAVPIEEDGE